MQFHKCKPYIGANNELKRYKNVLKLTIKKFLYVVLKEL